MIKNFLLIGIRNFARHRAFSILNVLGLTLGITSALFIFLILKFESSYDTYHTKAERIFRINAGGPGSPAEDMDTGSPQALATYLRTDFPEVEEIGIAFKLNPEQSQVGINQEVTRIKELYFVNDGFLKMFDIAWVKGNPALMMQKPNEAAVSEKMASQLFKDDAIGKTIRINNSTEFIVTGIFKDPPVNSDFPFEVMLSHKTLEQDKTGYFPNDLNAGWNSYYHTYVLLKSAEHSAGMPEKLKNMIEKHASKEVAEKRLGFAPIALSDIHFKNGNFNDRTISRASLTILGLIGLMILIIACINFTNLATAQAIRRARETGIRKCLGSSRKALVTQFLGETFIVVAAALVISIILVSHLATFSEALTEIPLNPMILSDADSLLFISALLVVVTMIAGFYPAFVISGYKPVTALKGSHLITSSGGLTLRKSLIAFQFLVSQALIIGTFIVILQVRFFDTKPLGFNKNSVLTTDIPVSDHSRLSTLRQSLLQYPEIKNVSFSLNTPSATINKWWGSLEHASFPGEMKSAEVKFVDSMYIKLFEIEKLAGTLRFTSDTADQVIVNETLLKECNIKSPEAAIGETISIWRGPKTIIGVVKDFQTVTLHEGYHPVVLTPSVKFLQKLSLKVEEGQADAAIAHLQKHWKETFPEYYFTYAFLDDSLATFYQEDRKISRLLGIFSIVAISIGCVGLFGLIMFVAVQRTKEVSIRKVLGATISNIITLLSKEFVLLVLFASACAWPLTYYLMDKWLQNFANAIVLSEYLWVFALAGLLSLLFAFVTVGSQALRSALANPAQNLRSE